MKIVIAEDDATSRKNLESVLRKWGYSVVSVCDGDQAWDVLTGEDAPRIAILDWIMPGLTGPELCRKLADKKNGSFVYTVLLTSKTQMSDKIEGLDAGAHSYLRKPLDQSELQSCLGVGERVIRYEETLREKNAQLDKYVAQMEQLAEERAHQLAHAERMATLGLLVAGIAHEINNPATFISGNAQTLEDAWSIVLPMLQNQEFEDSSESKQFKVILEEIPAMFAGIHLGVKRITKITNSLKGYARRGQPKKVAFDIDNAIEQALALCQNTLKYHVDITRDFCEDPPEIVGDVQQIEQILVNLFVNAGYAMDSHKRGTLSIATTCNESSLEVAVEDTGHGIPVENIGKLFDPFFTTKKAGDGTGLGLSISHDIAREHGGTLTAENRPEGGARFLLRLPICKVPTRASAEEAIAVAQGEKS